MKSLMLVPLLCTGCVLIGNTEDAETFEHLILDGLDLSQLGPSLLDPELEIADAFD